MVLRRTRKDAREKEDPADQRKVPYRLASYDHDVEGKKFKSSHVVYSFWSASKYVLILSLMLWWLPMFGQMIAGYVGGRRAGSPWKGIAASIIPVVCLYAVMTAFDSGALPSHVGGFAIAPAAIGVALNNNIPILSPYLHFSSEYIGGFVKGLAAASPYGINTYVLTVAFAYIGGVLAEQSRREIEFNSGAVMSNTTVLVQDPGAGFGQRPAVVEGASRGVLSGFGALLHLPHLPGRGYPAASAGFSSRRRGDSWVNASDMRYGDDVEELGGDELQEADDAEYEPRAQPTRQHGHHGHHHSPHKDPWHQKRRGATNFSAKPRLRYDQYEQRPKSGGYQGGSFRRNRGNYSFAVSPDARSIRKAERHIDNEWGNRKYASFRDQSAPRAREPEQETEAVAVHKREPHKSANQWDQI